jgi:hypothetical protein
MTRRHKDPLRPLTEEERKLLARISRSQAEPASHVARAKALVAVADGMSYTAAANAAGRRSGDVPSPNWSRASTEKDSPRSSRVTVAARLPSTPPKSASASLKRYAGDPIVKRREQQPGRFLRYRELCVGLLMGCLR